MSDTKRLAKFQTQQATKKFESDRALSRFLVKRSHDEMSWYVKQIDMEAEIDRKNRIVAVKLKNQKDVHDSVIFFL